MQILELPVRIDIAAASDLLPEWLKILEAPDHIQLNARHVESCTAAGAQLLLSVAKSANDSGCTISFLHVGDALNQDLAALGLSFLLINNKGADNHA